MTSEWPTWTGSYQTILVPMLQAHRKKQVNSTKEIPPGVHWGYACGHFLLWDWGDHGASVVWGNPQEKSARRHNILRLPCTIQGLADPLFIQHLISNWCFWETPPVSDPENFLICPTRLQPSALTVGCKILFQRKRIGEKRGW